MDHDMRENFGQDLSSILVESLVTCTVNPTMMPTRRPQVRVNFNLDIKSYALFLQIPKTLSGPYSPLEMKFSSMTSTGGGKEVIVDPLSVNSPSLDLQPQNPFDR